MNRAVIVWHVEVCDWWRLWSILALSKFSYPEYCASFFGSTDFRATTTTSHLSSCDCPVLHPPLPDSLGSNPSPPSLPACLPASSNVLHANCCPIFLSSSSSLKVPSVHGHCAKKKFEERHHSHVRRANSRSECEVNWLESRHESFARWLTSSKSECSENEFRGLCRWSRVWWRSAFMTLSLQIGGLFALLLSCKWSANLRCATTISTLWAE